MCTYCPAVRTPGRGVSTQASSPRIANSITASPNRHVAKDCSAGKHPNPHPPASPRHLPPIAKVINHQPSTPDVTLHPFSHIFGHRRYIHPIATSHPLPQYHHHYQRTQYYPSPPIRDQPGRDIHQDIHACACAYTNNHAHACTHTRFNTDRRYLSPAAEGFPISGQGDGSRDGRGGRVATTHHPNPAKGAEVSGQRLD